MGDILASAKGTTTTARQISLATQQQSTAAEQVTTALQDVSTGARQVADGSRETKEVIDDLVMLAGELRDKVGQFQVDVVEGEQEKEPAAE